MIGLGKVFTAALTVSFSTVVHGSNACLVGAASKCSSGTTDVRLADCGITNADLDDLKQCLDSIGRNNIGTLRLARNAFTTIPSGMFESMNSVTRLFLTSNDISTIDTEAFQPISSSLQLLHLHDNKLTAVQAGVFDNLASLQQLKLNSNDIGSIEPDAFKDLTSLQSLDLSQNELTTLPAGLFEQLGSSGTTLQTLDLANNPDLQCVPTADHAAGSLDLPTTNDNCVCTPSAAVTCGSDEVCAPGTAGYTCACTGDAACDTDNGEVCCPLTNVCENADDIDFDAGACGDPHMTGFRGQKFDFVGQDNAWYAVVSDLPFMHLNMRITAPVPSVPEITYITGISIVTTGADGLDHTIVIFVADPHSLESSCSVKISPCLADGALHVIADGEEVLLAPGAVSLAPDVAIAAVNLPGACRSFGFEKYWERKKLEMLAQSSRKINFDNTMQDMSDWVISDPTATNKEECAEYVARATAVGEVGLFVHQSEHASFQILTPTANIRLSHGRLHQLAMRDPTNEFDLPDHLTWQMNMAIDHNDLSFDATGILGETLVPTVNANGARIMQGTDAIRGKQDDYRVNGPLGVKFSQGASHE